MSVEIQGLDTLFLKLDKIGDVNVMKSKMTEAALFVEGVAREKAPERTGILKGSIESKVEVSGNEITATIFTPVEYAPYVEYGTGLFAVGGNGRKDVPWAYEDEQTGELIWTKGQHPQPFLQPALSENEDVIKQFIMEGLND